MFESVFNFLQRSLQTYANLRTPLPTRGRFMTGLLFASLLLDCAGAKARTATAPAPSVAAKHTAANYSKIPLSFEPNKGQTDPSVQFLSRGSGYSLFLTKDEVVLNLERQKTQATTTDQKPVSSSLDTLRMKLVGASATTTITGLEPQSGRVSYLIGNDPKKWHTGIETFGKVNFAQVYPGVDLVFYGNQRQLEYDFVVAPGADASRIAWQIDGAKPAIDADGNLVLSAANGPAGFKKPVLYQTDGDKKIAVDGAFTVAGNRIGFQLGSYDHAKALIIDPVLTYASYLGGSFVDTIGSWPNYNGSGNSYATTAVTQGIAIDSEGSAYVTGTTQSNDFPVQNPYMNTPAKSTASYSIEDTAFVTKFSPDGSSLVYSTYLGGSDSDNGMAITVDSAGEAFVTGWTDSPDFPTTSGAYQTICGPGYTDWWAPAETTTCPGGNMSPFLFKLNAAGSGLVYSTFLGGAGNALGEAIAVDAAGRAYLVGDSETSCQVPGYQGVLAPYSCFPTTSGAIISGTQVDGSDYNAFIAVFDPTGANLLYSSLFGDMVLSAATCEQGETCYGIADTFGISVAVDASGNFYLAGETNGMELPTTPGVIQPTTGPERSASQQNIVAGIRGFIAKFNPVTTAGGSSLAYATYLGGSTVEPGDSNGGSTDSVNSIITDANGNAYVYGATDSPDFPVTSGAYQTSCAIGVVNCQRSAFVAKLNPTGTALVWSTYLGSRSGNLDGVSLTGPIQLDGNGNVYVTGKAEAGNFPWVGNMEPYTGAPVFVSELDPTGSKLLFSTMFGAGNDSMMPAGLAVDPAGNMYVAMNDETAGTIVTPGSFQQTFGGWTDGFVAKISAQGAATVALAASPSPVAAGQSVTLTATVTPTATYASAPTGTIEFQDGSSALGTSVTLSSTGTATYTSTTLAPGTHSLTAVYSGDSTYPAGNAAQSLVVNGLTATVKVTPSPTSITTATSLQVTVAVSGSGATPTGTVTLSGGGYTSSAATLTSGDATITIPANSLSAGNDTLTVNYSGDANYNSASGTAQETVTLPLQATITVTPAASTVVSTNSLSVTVTVSGSGATPTGTITLSGGGYASAATTLANGSATIIIPANSLSAGNDTLIATYSGDTVYASTSGASAGTASLTVSATPLTASITVTAPAASDTDASLSVTVTVTGAGMTPTGTVTLSSGSYTSGAITLVGGSATIVIPANSLSAGTDVLSASYSGDPNYAQGTGATSGSSSPTETQSLFALAATTPAAVAAGSPATSTVTVSTTTAYSGTVALSCVLTNSPSGAVDLPNCSLSKSSVTLASGSTSVTATATVTSVGATSALASPVNGKQNNWMHLGGGAALALLVFLGIPARRRNWGAMLGLMLLLAAMGTISGCGGSSSSSGQTGTTAGSYTFMITAAGTPVQTPAPTTTFTLTIN